MTDTKETERIRERSSKIQDLLIMTAHVIDAALSVAALTLVIIFSSLKSDIWAIISGTVYGVTLVFMYAFSAIYHGKRGPGLLHIRRIIDCSMIYVFIGGTYTPIAICSIRSVEPSWGMIVFCAIWLAAAVSTVLTAVNVRKYAMAAMTFFIIISWVALFAVRPITSFLPGPGIAWLISGEAAYTIGAGIYLLGRKHRITHSIFHLLVLAGNILQFICIIFYVVL